jgi:hypothetical protein
MKYLKRYNESLDTELEEVQWCKDALQDLEDSGYKVSIRTYPVYGISNPGISITIDSNIGRLLPITIGEYLLTLHSYLLENGYVGFRPYDYDNPYSASRHQVTVNAQLRGVRNQFENELSQFVKMLDRFQVNAPFDSVSVNYYKPEHDIKESKIVRDSEVNLDVRDILLELELSEIKYSVGDFKYYRDKINPYNCILVKLKGKGKPFNLEEIKDVVLRLEDYLKQTNYSIDVAIPNTLLTDLETDHYSLKTFMNDFKDEEFIELNLYIWRGFNLTW